jgi:hypothetical protein
VSQRKPKLVGIGRWLLSGLLVFGIASCGGAAGVGQPAAPERAAPVAPSQPGMASPPPADVRTEPMSLPEAERALEQARIELEGTPGTNAKADQETGESACGQTCRAFSSLRRAADAVCRLAPPEEQSRCTRAKGTVAEAERRVAGCGCN